MEDAQPPMSGETHSVIDGLNRGKNALMNGHSHIHAKVIDEKDLKPLSKDEAEEHDRAAAEARKKGDYFTGSTFGSATKRYSVQHAVDLANKVPTKRIPTKGFVSQQVGDYWQGNVERAKNAIPSAQHPILIMKHAE